MALGTPELLVLLFLFVPLGLVAIMVIFGVMAYNRLVRARNQLREGWSGIEVQLKRRHDLVPALVECVRGYQTHERDLLESVTRERTEAGAAHDAASASGLEQRLGRDLGKIVALVEAYPELRADGRFLDLMRELVETEDLLQYARRYYNGSARDLNNTVESFPSNIVARMGGFKTAAFFEVERASERLPPDLAGQLRGGISH